MVKKVILQVGDEKTEGFDHFLLSWKRNYKRCKE